MYSTLLRQATRYAPRILSWSITFGGGMWFGSQHTHLFDGVKQYLKPPEHAPETVSEHSMNAAQLHAMLDLYHGEHVGFKK